MVIVFVDFDKFLSHVLHDLMSWLVKDARIELEHWIRIQNFLSLEIGLELLFSSIDNIGELGFAERCFFSFLIEHGKQNMTKYDYDVTVDVIIGRILCALDK